MSSWRFAIALLFVSIAAYADPPSSVLVGDVDHIGLTVTDLERSTKFFTDELQFELRGRDETYPAAFVANADITITLWQASKPVTTFDRKHNVGLHHLAFKVASLEALDALHDRLSNAEGVRIEFAPEKFYGGPAMHMMIREPSGNRLEFIHRPPAQNP